MTNNVKQERIQLTTPEFRVSYPAVFEPKKNNLNPKADPKYSIVMLFDTKNPKVAEGLKAMKEAVMRIITANLGPDQTKWPRNEKTGEFAFRTPFRDGKEKDSAGYGEGIIYAQANSTMKHKPGIVYPWAGPDGRPAVLTEPNDFYGGCYARATINPFWYDKGVNKGVSFGLLNIQKLRDGEPFGGGKTAENDFDPIEGADATAGKGEEVKAAPASGGGFPF